MTSQLFIRDDTDRLIRVTHELIALLDRANNEDSPGIQDAVEVISRYLALVASGLTTGSVESILKGVNGLTTVNKGLNDIVATATMPAVTAKGMDVSAQASNVAKRLRAG